MKIPFYKLYSGFFKTFKVDEDTLYIKRFKEIDKHKEAIIIKRSWLYGLAISWILIITLLLSTLNIYNLYNSLILSGHLILGYTIIGTLIISSILLIISSLTFIFKYKKTYGKGNNIENIDQIILELEEGDKLFINFFNQITTNLFLFYILILIYIYFIINQFIIGEITGFSKILFSIFDISLLFCQIWLMRYYRKKMIDLEMDFNVIVPGSLYFFNQSNMAGGSQSIESSKIKTVKGNAGGNFIMSFFNLGDMVVLTEGDQGGNGITNMFYVEDPKGTELNINKLRKQEVFSIKNTFLKKILNELSIKEKEFENIENINKVKNYLKENDLLIKEDYNKLDMFGKKEINEVYQIYYNK